MDKQLIYKPFGERAILIQWKAVINAEILKDILVFKAKVEQAKLTHIVDIIQGYHSLTILYNSYDFNLAKEVALLKSLYTSNYNIDDQKFYQWEIPVCYDVEFGIDLEEIVQLKKIDINSIIKLHTTAVYTVYFIGFLPGFLYLGGLHQQLFMDRKANPRLKVLKGSVGIGGKQTGVYPNDSAGGWNIIGKTPVIFFDVNKSNPCFAKPGDTIKFKAISKEKYYQLESKIEKGTYQIHKTLQYA